MVKVLVLVLFVVMYDDVSRVTVNIVIHGGYVFTSYCMCVSGCQQNN